MSFSLCRILTITSSLSDNYFSITPRSHSSSSPHRSRPVPTIVERTWIFRTDINPAALSPRRQWPHEGAINTATAFLRHRLSSHLASGRGRDPPAYITTYRTEAGGQDCSRRLFLRITSPPYRLLAKRDDVGQRRQIFVRQVTTWSESCSLTSVGLGTLLGCEVHRHDILSLSNGMADVVGYINWE